MGRSPLCRVPPSQSARLTAGAATPSPLLPRHCAPGFMKESPTALPIFASARLVSPPLVLVVLPGCTVPLSLHCRRESFASQPPPFPPLAGSTSPSPKNCQRNVVELSNLSIGFWSNPNTGICIAVGSSDSDQLYARTRPQNSQDHFQEAPTLGLGCHLTS
eukprot:EG_transcript_15047